MKKIIVLSIVLLTFLVTGCSVEIDTDSSKITSLSNKLEDRAEAIQNEFNVAMDMVNELEGKNSLTSKDKKELLTKSRMSCLL